MSRLLNGIGIIIALAAAYFAAITTLALTVDRRFLFNDAVSATIWVVLVIVAIGGGLAMRRR